MLTKEEFTSKDIPAVDKTIKVLEYLNQGRELEIGDITFKLGETHTNGFKLMIRYTETEYMGYHGDLDDFSSACNRITDDELTIMSANMVLTKINKR